MLTAEEVQSYLDRISYKPGWSFRAYAGQWEGMHVAITTEVPDSYHPDQTTTLDVHCFLSPNEYTDGKALERWLAWRLARIEIHEMREFLKRDGITIFDPHAEFADRDLMLP